MFSQYIVSVLNGGVSSSSIREMSVYISVLCAACSLRYSSSKKEKENSDLTLKSELEIIKSRFGCLFSEYKHVDSYLSDSNKKRIRGFIFDIYECNSNNRDVISWLYQYLKRDLAKIAFGNIGKDKNKINGEDLLFTTQFFTDEYMVEHLVDKVFEEKKGCIEDLLFVDPASGGGNFLSFVFDKLYHWYKANTALNNDDIVSRILQHHIVGYDLDSHLAKIASLSLYTNACRYGMPTSNIYIYGGVDKDLLGYLRQEVETSKIDSRSYEEIISEAKKSNRPIAYITNPPFMGKRDMDNTLKAYLLEQFPVCKGDLCVSFVQKMLMKLGEGDIIAVVSQNGWLNLSTLKMFRKGLLEQYFINECIDLGSNAFADINGEKTNVVLCTFEKQSLNATKQKSAFVNLKAKSYADKQQLSHTKSYDTTIIDSSLFLGNPSYEICYQLGVNFSSLRNLPQYGSFARCMQGTSTGNNKEFVRYAWEVCDDKDWVSVSKGGGYSKWSGLNYYSVKWGEDACHIKNNKGSAIRNLDHIEDTELVYSDTGTLGLNVRQKRNGQVFIASGPGIKVLSGLPICHMAFLNSKVATFLLKAKNPKFTISAGYISQLPIVESILSSNKIEDLAKVALDCKTKYLSNKLPNVEFSHIDYSSIKNLDKYIQDSIIFDMTNDYEKLKSEEAIDCEIMRLFKFSKVEKREMYEVVGGLSMTKYSNHTISLDQIDKAMSSAINDSCQFIGKKINGFAAGSESLLENIAYGLDFDIDRLYDMVCKNISLMPQVVSIYKTDLTHKILLKILKVEWVTEYEKGNVMIDDVIDIFKSEYAYLYSSLSISKSIIVDILTHYHCKCFFNKPIVVVEDCIAIIE